MKNFGIMVLAVGLLACQSKPERGLVAEVIDLPYYADANLNAFWMKKDDLATDTVHRIAPFRFTNQNGQEVTNGTFDGKVYVANFFFSICPNVCPRMTKNLHRVQSEFLTDDRVLIASHTVMPWVDTVARLHEYAQLNEIHSSKWHLLTGDQKEIYQLARHSYFADEGFGKTNTSDEDFLHTESIILIDKDRHIRGVYNGTIPLDVNRMIDDIHYLLAGP